MAEHVITEPSTDKTPASSSGFELLGEEFLSESQLANLLAKTERTISWWRENKQGPPYVKIGKSVLYRRSAVLRWIVESEVTPRKSRKGTR